MTITHSVCVCVCVYVYNYVCALCEVQCVYYTNNIVDIEYNLLYIWCETRYSNILCVRNVCTWTWIPGYPSKGRYIHIHVYVYVGVVGAAVNHITTDNSSDD